MNHHRQFGYLIAAQGVGSDTLDSVGQLEGGGKQQDGGAEADYGLVVGVNAHNRVAEQQGEHCGNDGQG